MNFFILLPAFLAAVWYPKVGSLAAMLGAVACMFVVYFIPIVTYLKFKSTSVNNPELARIVRESVVSPRVLDNKDRNIIVTPEITSRYTETTNTGDADSTKTRRKEFILGVFLGVICMSYGIFVVIVNFM